MGRSGLLFVAVVTATILAGACGVTPQRVEVGELRTESRSVEAEGAESARATLRLAVGKLDVGGGAGGTRLMEADFAYNVAAWKPGVDYKVVGDSGELNVQQQGLTEGIPTQDVRNAWDLRLNEAVPVELVVQMGGGVGNLDLDSLALTKLNLDVGAGSTRVDLSGDWGRDVSAVVRGGAGEVTLLVPSEMGTRVEAGTRLGRITTEGLQKDGKAYVNDAYGGSGPTLEVQMTGGIGQINLQTVQGQEGDRAERQGAATTGQQETTRQETTRQQGGAATTAQGGGTTTMQEGAETTMEGGGTTMMEGGGATTMQDDAIGLSAILDDPRRYYGQTTTVDGAVGQVIEPRAFVMVDEQAVQDGPPNEVELAEGGVLVVRTGGPPPDVTELQSVRTTGTLQAFDVASFEQQQGVDLDEALYSEYEDRPVLVAADVEAASGEGTAP